MGKSGQELPKVGVICPQILGDRVAQFLRRKHPAKTAEAVAAEIDVSVSTARKWLDRSSAPSLSHFGLMLYAYGAEFAVAVFPDLVFAEVAFAAHRREAAARQHAEAEEQLARLVGRRGP